MLGGDEKQDDATEAAPSSFSEFGSTKSPAHWLAPRKWRLLPHFLEIRGLKMRQHIDSFNTFIDYELKQIVHSPSACEILSEHDPKFYIRYTDCWVGEPSVEEDSYATSPATPFQCRLRDVTYSAPIYVNVRYTRGRQIVVKRNVMVGRMLIMLRSSKCLLHGKTEQQMAALIKRMSLRSRWVLYHQGSRKSYTHSRTTLQESNHFGTQCPKRCRVGQHHVQHS